MGWLCSTIREIINAYKVVQKYNKLEHTGSKLDVVIRLDSSGTTWPD
jgi:hypothetical protein